MSEKHIRKVERFKKQGVSITTLNSGISGPY
jgi:hypothetical protein